MFGLYIHIPFCQTKCSYCDFNSRPAGQGEIGEYLGVLIEELTLFSKGNRRIVETLYFGGGTPTLLSEREFTLLLEAVHDTMTLTEDAEITVEANPGAIDYSKAGHLRSLGVNRISLGVQSLHDSLLSRLGRIHTSTEALDTLEMLRTVGFDNIATDLIYGIPGQTQKDWTGDLERLIQFGPEHLSLYGLSIEKGTAFHRERKEGRLDLPSEEEQIRMYKTALHKTKGMGYEHYEISNYARPGYRSRHNTLYWTMEEYYGAGAGAHSFLRLDGPLRLSNVADPAEYIKRMKGSKDPVARREFIKKKTFLAEAMMLGLRRTEGVEIKTFRERYGADPLSHFSGMLNRGYDNHWIEIEKGRIRLTAEGLLFSNEVFMDLF
jgi:oxygen-independent coproporphyrinogen-3 oxidase